MEQLKELEKKGERNNKRVKKFTNVLVDLEVDFVKEKFDDGIYITVITVKSKELTFIFYDEGGFTIEVAK